MVARQPFWRSGVRLSMFIIGMVVLLAGTLGVFFSLQTAHYKQTPVVDANERISACRGHGRASYTHHDGYVYTYIIDGNIYNTSLICGGVGIDTIWYDPSDPERISFDTYVQNTLYGVAASAVGFGFVLYAVLKSERKKDKV